MSKFYALVLMLFVPFFACTQGVGLNPQNIDWQVIKTDQASIIFDMQKIEQARRTATIIAYLDEKGKRSIGEKSYKFDLVLRHYSAIPNGYVALAPFRSEYFLTPPDSPFLGTTQWADVLTVHEYRHVLQFSNGRRGLSKLAYFLFGEVGQTVANVIAVPLWFYEGDAVIYETALTAGGRGRAPSFTRELRAMTHEDVRYSYAKFRNRSLKDFVPDHYRLGYTMLSHVRNEKGNDITGEIYRKAVTYRKVIYPFSMELKAHTGKGVRGTYRDAMESYGNLWKAQQDNIEENSHIRVTEEKRFITNYRFPKVNSEGRLYAVKSSVKKIREIVKFTDEIEEGVVKMGSSLSSYYDLHGENLAWAEFSNDFRRNNKEYSDIVVFIEGKKKRLTKNKRYFSPTFSKGGNALFAIEVAEAGHPRIVELSIEDGSEISGYDFDKMVHLMRPAIIDDNEIAFIKQENSKVTLEKINWRTGEITALTKTTEHTIDTPFCKDGYVYYSAGYTGVEDIYKVPTDGSKLISKVTSAKVAALSPFVDDKNNLYYTHEYQRPIDMEWMDYVAETAEGGDVLENVQEEEHEHEEYKGALRGLRFHSYVPSFGGNVIGLGTVLNNVLDDKQLSLSAGYNLMTGDYLGDVSLRIGNFLPVFDIGVSTRRVTSPTNRISEDFTEFAPGLNVFIPLRQLKGIYTTEMRLGIDSRYRIQRNISLSGNPIEDREFYTGELRFTSSILRARAQQNMRSRLGASLSASYGLSSLDFNDSQLNALGRVYLPGLLPNHSLLVTGAIRQASKTRQVTFNDSFEYPRGLAQFIPIAAMSAQKYEFEYALPLLYPDFGIAGIVYFRRVKANLFFENLGFESSRGLGNYRTYGMDLIFDNIYLNLAPASFGLTFGYGQIGDQNKPYVAVTSNMIF